MIKGIIYLSTGYLSPNFQSNYYLYRQANDLLSLMQAELRILTFLLSVIYQLLETVHLYIYKEQTAKCIAESFIIGRFYRRSMFNFRHNIFHGDGFISHTKGKTTLSSIAGDRI